MTLCDCDRKFSGMENWAGVFQNKHDSQCAPHPILQQIWNGKLLDALCKLTCKLQSIPPCHIAKFSILQEKLLPPFKM